MNQNIIRSRNQVLIAIILRQALIRILVILLELKTILQKTTGRTYNLRSQGTNIERKHNSEGNNGRNSVKNQNNVNKQTEYQVIKSLIQR
jgi:hypothetical protein